MDNREGNLEAPRREPLDWQSPSFYDRDDLNKELERVFDICHGCRRCVSLCKSFPTLFDLVDESETMEVDSVDKQDYIKVVDECFLCDLCAETKCPYLPPHPWAVDFPHLMLRSKAQKFREGKTKFRDKLIASTDTYFPLVSTPGIAGITNAVAKSQPLRKLANTVFSLHPDAPLPAFESKTALKRLKALDAPQSDKKVAIYVTCYGNSVAPSVVEALVNVLMHNRVDCVVIKDMACCGVPKLEIGDLRGVKKLKEKNIPLLLNSVEDGRKIMSIVPSCTWMYRMEMPLLYPDDADVKKVSEAMVSPFEYLLELNKEGHLKTDFKTELGKVTYHAACHQRTQNIGPKTREFLAMIPGSEVTQIERCSGHDGSYAFRSETYDHAKKISAPVVRKVKSSQPDTWGSDCPMASNLIEQGLEGEITAEHPIEMVARAYGLN